MKRINYILLPLFILACSCNGVTQNEEYLDFYVGSAEWNPDQFASMPAWSPIDLSFHMELDMVNEVQVLNLELELHNPSVDSIYIVASASAEVNYDFVVVGKNSFRVWNRMPYGIRTSAPRFIPIGPNESIYFRETWDFTNYEGDRLESDSYAIFGGIEGLGIAKDFPEGTTIIPLYPDSIKSLENILGSPGVGIGPKLISL